MKGGIDLTEEEIEKMRKKLQDYLDENGIEIVVATDNGIMIKKNDEDDNPIILSYNNTLKANIEKIEKNI